MVVKTYFDVAGQVICKHPCGLLKLECRADDSLAAGRFWQVHDFAPEAGLAAPADGAVPIKSWPAYAGAPDYKEFKNGDLALANGLYVCVSSTEGTKTLGTGTDKFAFLSAELPKEDTYLNAVSVEATAATSLQVWAESDTPLKLVRVKATNKELSNRYLQLFAVDAPAENDKPIVSWLIGTVNSSIELRFGTGRSVRQIVTGDLKTGCSLFFSTAAASYSTVGLTGGGMDVYAEKL